MAREIAQRELRNESGEIMRALDRGESFVLTRNGVAVGELRPVRRRTLVPAAEVRAALAGLGRVDYQQLREDLDDVMDQDPTPRA